MKRAFAIVLASVLLLSGCGQASVSGPTQDSDKLWAVDIGQEGFSRTGASQEINRVNGDSNLRLTITPEAYYHEIKFQNVVKANGREYDTGEGILNYDGPQDSGSYRTRSVQWKHGGLAYLLVAEESASGTILDIASPKTAALLEKDPMAELPGFQLKQHYWSTRLTKNGVGVDLLLYSPIVSEKTAQTILKNISYKLVDEGGMKYYLKEKADSQMNIVSILWKTDKGLVYLYATGAARENSPADTLDFINVELAKSITEQMGAKIVPLSESAYK